MMGQQQKRAAFALTKVTALNNLPENQRCHSEFVSYASALAAMIYQNGFGQTVAFCLAKSTGDDNKAHAYAQHYRLLEEWLCHQENAVYSAQKAPNKSLIQAITHHDMTYYRAAENEAIELMGWVKTFSKAYLED